MRILATLLLLAVIGCQCPEKAILREGMDQATRTIRADQKDWAGKLVVDPLTGQDRRAELPAITVEQYQQYLKAHEEYENLVNEDRSRDNLFN